MLLTKLDILFGKYAIYVTGVALVLSVIFGVGWYTALLQRDNAREQKQNAEMRLTVSNSSIQSLKLELGKVNQTLIDNERKAEEGRTELREKLKLINANDKTRVALEQALKHRTSTMPQCKTPKDLQDAASRM